MDTNLAYTPSEAKLLMIVLQSAAQRRGLTDIEVDLLKDASAVLAAPSGD